MSSWKCTCSPLSFTESVTSTLFGFDLCIKISISSIALHHPDQTYILQYWHDWIASLACCEIGRLLRNDLVCGILNTFFPMLDTAFYLWRASCHRRYNNYWFLFLCLHVQNSFVYQHCESESEIIIIISLSPRGFPRLIYNSLWRTLARLLFRSLQFILEGERCPRPD